jgi:hypothetical protein
VLSKAPSAIVSTFFLNDLLSTKIGFVILAVLNCVALFTYYSLNVVVLELTNKTFSRELRIIFRINKNRLETTNGDTNTNKY